MDMTWINDWLSAIPSPYTRKSCKAGFKKFEEFRGIEITDLDGTEISRLQEYVRENPLSDSFALKCQRKDFWTYWMKGYTIQKERNCLTRLSQKQSRDGNFLPFIPEKLT